MRHTPGPWEAVCGQPWQHRFSGNTLQTCEVLTKKTRAQLNEEGYNYEKYLADVANITVCIIGTFQKDIVGDEAIANAHLIAAAPEMLEVLLALQPYLQNYLEGKVHDPAVAIWADEHTEGNFQKAIAVINKASGIKEGVK